MPTPSWTRVVIFLSAGLALLFALLTGTDIDQDALLKMLGGISSAVVILLLIYDRWVWRYWPFRYLTGRPILHGTWKATLDSDWVDPETGERVPPKDAYVVISQTYSTVSVTMLFDISQSYSMSADLCRQNEIYVLAFIYRSEAEALEQQGNPPHRGGAALYVSTEPTTSFQGDYWTDRKTKGRITSHGHSPKIHQAYRNAMATGYEARND